MKPKVVYVDMDDVLAEYSQSWELKRQQRPEQAYPQAELGFFSALLPKAGAISVMHRLLSHPGFEPYIATAPSIYNPLCYMEKRLWIERHLGMAYVDRLIIISNKGLLQGDLLIDDYIEGKGQEFFKGEIWQFGSTKFPDWKSVEECLFGIEPKS